MLKKHNISSKSLIGKRLMIEAKTRAFSVNHKLMNHFHEERRIEEVSQNDENLILMNSSLTPCPRSPLKDTETLLNEAGITEETSIFLHPPINEVYSICSDSISSSVCCQSSQTIHIETSCASTQTTAPLVSWNCETSGFKIDTEYNPTHSINETNDLPTQVELVDNFAFWMSSMDGGSHPEEICYKAKLIIQTLLQNLSCSEITDPMKVCKYFTERESAYKLAAGTINIYLRYFSSFILFLHQSYSQIMPFDKYQELEQRIKRFVVFTCIL